MSDDQSREIFREEALELLAELEATLLELEAEPTNLDLVNRAFRALHTVKGSGAMFGFDDIAEFTHDIENIFDKIRNDELYVTKELITVSFAARDHIMAMLGAADAEASHEQGEAILSSLRALPMSQHAESASPPAEAEAAPAAAPGESAAAAELSAQPEPEPGPPVCDASALEDPEGAECVGVKRYRLTLRPRVARVDKELYLEPLFEGLRALGTCAVLADRSAVPNLAELNPGELHVFWVVDLTTESPKSAIEDLFFFTDIDLDVTYEPLALDAPALTLECRCGKLPDHLPDNPPDERPTRLDLEEAPPKKLGEMLVEEGAIKPEDLDKALKQQKPLGKILTEQGVITEQQVEKAVARQQREREPAKPAAAAPKDAGTSLRVAADKLDTLVDLVGELVIVQAQISQVVSERGDGMLTMLAEQLERLSAELRDSTLGIRMLPIGSTFSKFRRLVRDLSSELGKEIDLVTRGEETELDKTVMERLGDPLVHLLRNSLDHGIEMPEVRQQCGKKPAGLILLEAEHSGSDVLIRITDDGKGLDPEALRAKAVDKGLIAADAELSEGEIYKLIFLPGFSTAAKVTNISGRGVGMDVVHRAIDSLRGTIEITSAKGSGTTITIRLPLTLAIIEGLQVQVGDGYFVIPLSIVEECVEIFAKDKDVGRDQQLVNLRGELVPYINLRRWFEIEGESPAIEQIVITGVDGRRVGIAVDHVIGEYQTVIKSLGRVYRDADGVSGATIRGDGTLALILDVPRLVRSVSAQPNS